MAIVVQHSSADLHQEQAEVACRYTVGGIPVEWRCRLLLAGRSVRSEKASFDHPHPPFSRLFLFPRGAARVTMAGQAYRLHGKTLFLLPATVPFSVEYGSSELIYFHLHICDMRGFSVFADADETPVTLRDGPLFHRLVRAARNSTPGDLTAGLFDATSRLLEPRLPKLLEQARAGQRFGPLLRWMQAEPPATLTVARLARQAHLSRAAFSKGFQRAMGIAPKTCIDALQMQRARELLLYTDKTIQAIARELGHAEPHYFYRFFRKHAAMTPGAYRRTARPLGDERR